MREGEWEVRESRSEGGGMEGGREVREVMKLKGSQP